MPIMVSTASKDPYLEMVRAFPLRPIRSREAHRKAKATLRRHVAKRGSAVRDYKAILVSLIANYERAMNLRLDTSKVSAAQVALHLLDERGMSANALAKALQISQSSL